MLAVPANECIANESSQRGGFSPASDLGRRSVLRWTVGSRWRHSRRHTSPLCRPEAATTAADRAAADRAVTDRAADSLAFVASPFAFSGSSSVEPRESAARTGVATRPSSGLLVGMRWLGRRCRARGMQRMPAYVRRPCRCSALVCARICSCSRRADHVDVSRSDPVQMLDVPYVRSVR